MLAACVSGNSQDSSRPQIYTEENLPQLTSEIQQMKSELCPYDFSTKVLCERDLQKDFTHCLNTRSRLTKVKCIHFSLYCQLYGGRLCP